MMKQHKILPWLLPVALALPIAAAAAAVLALYGSDLLDLVLVALKMVVIA